MAEKAPDIFERKKEIVRLMLELEAALTDFGGSVSVHGTPPAYLNQSTFHRLMNGTLFPNSPSRSWMMSDLADLVGFLARDWRGYQED